MSMHHEVGITCPKCQKAGVFTVWDSINTKLDPDMKDRVKSLEAFRYHCGHCGTDVQVDYGFLYHDMDHHFMVFYAPTDKDQEMPTAIWPTARINSRPWSRRQAMSSAWSAASRFVGKIAIFEAGLDDRLMELTKASACPVWGKDRISPLQRANFVTADDGSLRLNLIDGTHGQQAYVDFANGLGQLYGQFEKNFAADLPAEDAVLARIDADWTQQFLNKYLYN